MIDLSWMAWTWPTVTFFSAIALSITAMGIWEKISPGGAPRKGVFGLNTTRGDRLFISWLGTGFINIGWLAFYGSPLWGALVISILWVLFVFKLV